MHRPMDDGFTLDFPVYIVEDTNALVEEILQYGALGFFKKARTISDESIDEYYDVFPVLAERLRLLWDQGDFGAILHDTAIALDREIKQMRYPRAYTGFWSREVEWDAETKILWLYRRLAAFSAGSISLRELQLALSDQGDRLNSMRPIPYIFDSGLADLEPEQIITYVLLNRLTFPHRHISPSLNQDGSLLPRIVIRLVKQKQFWAAESLAEPCIRSTRSNWRLCNEIANQACDMSSRGDVYENLGRLGVLLGLCEGLLCQNDANTTLCTLIYGKLEAKWHALDGQILVAVSTETDSEPETSTESTKPRETASLSHVVMQGDGPTSSLGMHLPGYTRSELRFQLIKMDLAVAACDPPNVWGEWEDRVAAELEKFYSAAVANDDKLLTRTIQWRSTMLYSGRSSRRHLMETDLVPESIYKLAQDALLTRGRINVTERIQLQPRLARSESSSAGFIFNSIDPKSRVSDSNMSQRMKMLLGDMAAPETTTAAESISGLPAGTAKATLIEHENTVVIGVDFGSAFTAVAYASTRQTASSADEIKIVNNWPGTKGSFDKVPSELSYGPPKKISPTESRIDHFQSAVTHGSQSKLPDSMELRNAPGDFERELELSERNGNEIRWGYQLEQDEVRLRYLKPFLDATQEVPAYIRSMNMQDLLRNSNRSAEVAVADYLAEIFKHTRETLVETYGESFTTGSKIRAVLTVPAICLEVTQRSISRAARYAGKMAELFNAEDLTIAFEPEAAAVYTLQSIQSNLLKIGVNFVVCDAGASAVNLIAYSIIGLDPLSFEELDEGLGKWCGAALLDARFEAHVRTKLGEETFSNVCEQHPGAWRAALKAFEEYVKPRYYFGKESTFDIPFPCSQYEGDDSSIGLEREFLSMTSQEVGEIFRPVVNDVVELVEQQLSKLKAKNKEVSAILLLGGFGQSPALYQALQDRFKQEASFRHAHPQVEQRSWPAKHKMEIIQPANVSSAVACGAVLLNPRSPGYLSNRTPRYHYGVTYTEPFNVAVHTRTSNIWSVFDEEFRAHNCVKWFIRKGSAIRTGEPIVIPLHANLESAVNSMYRTKLVFSDTHRADLAPPVQYEDHLDSNVNALCTLEVNLNTVPEKHWTPRTTTHGFKFKRLDFELVAHVEEKDIILQFLVNDVAYGRVVGRFEAC